MRRRMILKSKNEDHPVEDLEDDLEEEDNDDDDDLNQHGNLRWKWSQTEVHQADDLEDDDEQEEE